MRLDHNFSYSWFQNKNYRLQDIQLLARHSFSEGGLFFEIVWDDRQCDEAPLIAALRIVGPRTTMIHLRFMIAAIRDRKEITNGESQITNDQVSRWS